jgi:hypothetical protein
MRVRLWAFVPIAAIVLGDTAVADADGVLPSDATAVQREQAQALFVRGKELFAKRQYDDARALFVASHGIVASPNTRLQIARCLRAMGKLVDAYAELGRTEVEAKELNGTDNRYKLASDAASLERSELEPKLAFVSLTVTNPSDGTRVTIGGEEIRRAAWGEPAPVAPGTTEIALETPGHAPVKTAVNLTQGAKTALTIDAQSGEPLVEKPPAPEAPPVAPPPPVHPFPFRTAAYVAGGVGVAGLVTFAVSGTMARSTYNSLQNACGSNPCPPDKAGEISSGKTQQTVANVGLVFGVLGVGAGTALFVLSLSKSPETPASAIVVAPAWIGVRGSL